MPPDTTGHLLQLTTTALDELETASITASVRRAWRIARLRGDLNESIRFALELGAYEDLGDLEPSAEMYQLRLLIDNEFKQDRKSHVDPSLLGLDSIDELTMQPLWSLPIDARPYEDDLSLQSRIRNENRRAVAAQIVERVRNYTCQYLMTCETTLRFSIRGNAIFDRYRERVDRLLGSLAPEVLEMLNSAIRRAAVEDEAEARVHALTSCRRVLVAVADHVFPARDEPHLDRQGRSRDVGEHQYRNRILAAIELEEPSTLLRALSASIDDFAVRLDRLDDLTQKGVHDLPTSSDVDFGVVQTYMIAGEVLSMARPS